MPEGIDLISEYNRLNNFGIDQGLTLKVIKPGFIEYRMKILDRHFALPNVVHGGVLAGMMDAILSVAAFSSVAKENKQVATVDFKINYLRPVKSKMEVLGTGQIIKKGKSIIFTEGKIFDEAKNLVATGTGTIKAYSL